MTDTVRSLSDEQLSHLFEQLSLLLGAGITAADGLAIMREDEDNSDLGPVLEELSARIGDGASLSDAAACAAGSPRKNKEEGAGSDHPPEGGAPTGAQTDSAGHSGNAAGQGVFPAYAVQVLRIGEETGSIDRSCAMLSGYYEEQAELHTAVRDAFFYPFLMILMMFILIVILLTNVMPLFAQVFEQLGASVSGIALILLNISNALSRGYAVLIVIALIMFAVFLWLVEMPSGQRVLHLALQRFPLTAGFAERMAVGRFASSLQITQASGMDTQTALSLCREVADNDAVAARIDACAKSLSEGTSLAESLSDAGLFSGFYAAMIRVAAETGEVDTVLGYIAQHYKEETDRSVDRLLSGIEPAIVAATAVIVGVILLSVILPLMGVMTSIG